MNSFQLFGDYFPVKKYVTMENGDRVIRAFGINLFGKERDVGETHIESIEGDFVLSIWFLILMRV